MYKISIQKSNVKETLGRQDGTDGKRALKWIFRKPEGSICTVCCCECCNKLSYSIRGRVFNEELSNYQHLKEGLSYKTLVAQFLQS
jgi:hypothetical protein